ncbi:MAG: ABC transporter ATP-binding protein [Desulfobacula sp.]|jgi:ATP-binding cassette subfamily B protein
MPEMPISMEENEIKLADLYLAKTLWPYIRPYSFLLFLTTLLVFIVTFFELIMPILTQKAFDGFILPVSEVRGVDIFGLKIHSFSTFCLLFSIAVLASFIIDFFQSLLMEYTGQTIILNLRCKLFNHMAFLPVAFYDKTSSGRLVSRVAGDIENMNEMFTSVLIFIFRDLFLMIGILVILFNIDIKLAFYLTAMVPVIVFSIALFSKILRKAFRTIRQKLSEINHSFSEAITGIKIIHTTSSRNRFMEKFKILNFEYFSASLFQIRIFAVFMPFIGFMGVLSVAIILWSGSFKVMGKSLTLGELVAFLSYMKLFFRPLRDLSETFNLLQNALSSAERIISILKTEKARQRVDIHREPISRISQLSFKKVNFSYTTGKPVLKGISFDLPQNRSIGIVGKTGSGKSSIINLITGFYQPENGAIFFNGINQNSINIEDLRKRTALVMQDPVLFSGSIRENIKPSGVDMDPVKLEKALYEANCDFLFEKFSGLDTEIEEEGRPLSSGEKQLVCIARAFAFDPDLIIFDEATSYMDSNSEQKVHDAMRKLMKGRLSIIIAHRLSTVRECDSILLLRDGSFREQGSHHELVALKGEYYHLLEKEKI